MSQSELLLVLDRERARALHREGKCCHDLTYAMTSKCDETPEPELGFPGGLFCWDVLHDHACPRYLESANTLHKLEKISEENAPFCEMKVPVAPVRIWRALAPDNVEDSCVEKLAWSAENRLWALCGRERKYVAEIVDGRLLDVVPAQDADAAVLALFDAEPVRVSEKVRLPVYPGRQFKRDYVAAEFSGGRVIVGTADAMLAIVEGDRAFSLGSVADNGPVRCMSTNPDRTVLYGVAGDDEDLGTIFSYDDQNGVIRHGFVNTEMIDIGDTAAISLLSACAVSSDGKYLAVGAGDRLGTVVLYEL